MSGTRVEIARAETQAAVAKARLQLTAARLKNRLNPAVRARETWEDVRDKAETLADDAIELAYERPRTLAGVAGIGALFLIRRRMARLARRVFRRGPSKWDTAKNHPAGLPAAGREGDKR